MPDPASARVRVFAPATVRTSAPRIRRARPGPPAARRHGRGGGGGATGRRPGGGHRRRQPPAAERGAATGGGRDEKEVLRPARSPAGIRLRLRKGMPLESGLGSSGASAAAGAVAANEVLGSPLTDDELVRCAMAGERAACGSARADNVAPAVLGRIVLIRSYNPLDLVRLPVPDGLFIAVVHPHCEVSTSEARARLAGRAYALPDIVANAGNLGALVAALHQGNLALLGRCIDDHLVEPVRAAMIPAYAEVRAAARAAGALAAASPESGPSMFALCDSDDAAARSAVAMRRGFKDGAALGSEAWVCPVNRTGAHFLE